MPYFFLFFEYILKEQLFKYISRMDCVKDLPVDVLSKIASYKIGDPKYLKIKYNHIEALKRIQNKYKISRLGPKITRHLKSRKNIYN